MKPGSRKSKRLVRKLLRGQDWEFRLGELGKMPPRRLTGALISCLSDPDQTQRRRAALALGMTVAGLFGENPEEARQVMRRLIWSLSEECGAIGWGSPEALGAVMARSEQLAQEYLNILLSYVQPSSHNYLEFRPLQEGALWGLEQVARANPGLAAGRGGEQVLEEVLDSADSLFIDQAQRIMTLIVSHH